MDDYGNHVDTLERELSGLLDVFKGLTPEQWQTQTLLVPFDPERPHWTLFELAEHFDISIGLAHMLVDDPQPEGQPGRDRVSFFIFPRSEVAPVVYDFAYTMVDGKTPADMPGVIETTFAKVIEGARSNPARPDRLRVLRAHGAGGVHPEPRRRGGRARAGPDRPARRRPDRVRRRGSRRPRRSWTSCSHAARWALARRTCPTTWNGSGRRRDAGRRGSIPIHGCR